MSVSEIMDTSAGEGVFTVVAGYMTTVAVRQSITLCRGSEGGVGLIARLGDNEVSLALSREKAQDLAAGLAGVLG